MLGKIKTVLVNNHKAGWALILLAALLVGVGVVYTKLSDSGTIVKCQDSLIRKAAPLLDLQKRDELKYVAQDIEKIDGYRSDANCLNIVVTYYTHIADPTKARENLDSLKKIYDPKVGFSPLLGSYVKSIDKLSDDVALMEKVKKQIETNTLYMENHQ